MQNLDFSGFNVPMYAESVVESVSKVSNNAIVERDLSHFEDWNVKKVQDLTLEQLCMTSRENNDGAPNNGIRHYVLIQKVLDMCNERGLHGEVRDLFVSRVAVNILAFLSWTTLRSLCPKHQSCNNVT